MPKRCQKAKTIDAYGRSLNDFLAFCQRFGIVPETITREQVGLYVHDLAHRPNPKGAKLLSIENGRGLSNSTMQQRITVLRLFCDSLVERQLRRDNPVGVAAQRARSEEHTSELQSHLNLVCRLLLEKKKI